MISREKICEHFGSKPRFCKALGMSRVTLNRWINQGFVPRVSTSNSHYGTNWHENIQDLGVNPESFEVTNEKKLANTNLALDKLDKRRAVSV